MTQETNQEEPRLRILILDDEPIVCKRLKPAFQKLGYEVETFTESASALARLQETSFDIVITDLKMEGVDGMQILTQAKESAQGYPCDYYYRICHLGNGKRVLSKRRF